MHKNRNPQICSIYSFPAPTSRFFSFEPTASLLPRRLYTFQPLTVSTAPVVETALSARLKNGNWPLTPATSIQVASSSSNPYHLMRTGRQFLHPVSQYALLAPCREWKEGQHWRGRQEALPLLARPQWHVWGAKHGTPGGCGPSREAAGDKPSHQCELRPEMAKRGANFLLWAVKREDWWWGRNLR